MAGEGDGVVREVEREGHPRAARDRVRVAIGVRAVQRGVLLLLRVELRLQGLQLLLVLREVLRDEGGVVDEAHGVDSGLLRLLLLVVLLLLMVLLRARGVLCVRVCVRRLLVVVLLLLFLGCLKATRFLHAFEEGLICEFGDVGMLWSVRKLCDDLVLLDGDALLRGVLGVRGEVVGGLDVGRIRVGVDRRVGVTLELGRVRVVVVEVWGAGVECVW